MKLKLDEHLPTDFADYLRAVGLDVATAVDQRLGGSPDSDLISACRAEGRALITLDVGFADIRSYPPDASPGLIVLRLARHGQSPYSGRRSATASSFRN